MNYNLLRALPLLAMLVLAALLALGIFNEAPETTPKHLIGLDFARIDVPTLTNPTIRFTPKVWKGEVAIVNAFASWCEPCIAEHALLMNIAAGGKVPIYGLAWKDNAQDVAKWLQTRGNPYRVVGVDFAGDTTMRLSLTGVPQTYVVDKNGQVAYHYSAQLTEDIVNGVILPLVEKLQQGNVR